MAKRKVKSSSQFIRISIGLVNFSVFCAIALSVAYILQPATSERAVFASYRLPQTVIVKKKPVKGVPSRIKVSSAGIDLPVEVGSYRPEDLSWTIGDSSAYFADRTVPANDTNGTTLIYGHATAPIFARIPYIRTGAEAEIATDNGLVFIYSYLSTKDVLPEDTSVLDESGPPRLALQTCSGPFDMYRTIVFFEFVEVKDVQ